MILLDTHIWIWWVHADAQLTQTQVHLLEEHEHTGLGISAISCWEVCKLVERKRLELSCDIANWLERALAYPGIQLLDLPPAIAIDSTQLPGEFHRDPADQIIVATARILECPLLTNDDLIKNYPHVTCL